MINEFKHCGQNLVSFKAARINGTVFIEQFVNETPIQVHRKWQVEDKSQWGAEYEKAVAEATRLTREFEQGAQELKEFRAQS